MIKIAPSLLAADFASLATAIQLMETGGADYLHCDIMDGSFVPPITFGAQMVSAVKARTALPLDVHLMVVNPDKHADAFIEAGASVITFHPDACFHPQRLLGAIKEKNVRAGLALSPGTPLESARWMLRDCDMVLLMSVNPGYGGQKFIPEMLVKIARLKELRDSMGLSFDIEVDGGINDQTAPQTIAAGADVLVAGNYVFSAQDPCAAISGLREQRP